MIQQGIGALAKSITRFVRIAVRVANGSSLQEARQAADRPVIKEMLQELSDNFLGLEPSAGRYPAQDMPRADRRRSGREHGRAQADRRTTSALRPGDRQQTLAQQREATRERTAASLLTEAGSVDTRFNGLTQNTKTSIDNLKDVLSDPAKAAAFKVAIGEAYHRNGKSSGDKRSMHMQLGVLASAAYGLESPEGKALLDISQSLDAGLHQSVMGPAMAQYSLQTATPTAPVAVGQPVMTGAAI